MPPRRGEDVLPERYREGHEFLPQRHRHGVLELRAAELEDTGEFARLGFEGTGEPGERSRERVVAEKERQADRRRIDVVRRLGKVHVVVGVDDVEAALRQAEMLQRAVHHDLVDVHVRRGARPALEDVEDELVGQRAAGNVVAGGDDRLRLGPVEVAQLQIGESRGFLHKGQRPDEDRVVPDRNAGNPEVADGPCRLGAVIGLGIDVDFAEGIVLTAPRDGERQHVGHVGRLSARVLI